MLFDVRPGVRRLFRMPLWTSGARDRDVDDEIESLIASRVEYLVARGVSQEAARAEALRRWGGSLEDARRRLHASAHQRERRMRFSEFCDSVKQDVQYAARGLARRPAFTALSMLTLAIGIGATTAIFSAVNVLLLRPLPYARPNELMRVSLALPAEGVQPRHDMGWSYPMFTMFRGSQHVFSDEAVYSASQFTLTSGDVERLSGEYVGATYLRVLGLTPTRGRDFDPALDAHAGAPRQAIVSYALWERRFNADPSIVGRTIDIDRDAWTIIGVGPRDFRGLTGQADLLLPVTAQPAPALAVAQLYTDWLVARRAPGVTRSQAAAATVVVGAQVGQVYPNPMGTLKWDVSASPLDDVRLEPAVRQSLLVLFGAVGLVLLIACVNVANLLLARASARRGEIAIRMAMGAGRARVVRLLLTESLLLALVAGLTGVALAWVGVHALAAVDPSAIAHASGRYRSLGAVAFSSIALDWRALAFTLAVSLVVGILFGLSPAIVAARESLTGALENDRAPSRGRNGRRTLVVAEFALALVLLAGSGLMIRSLAKLLTVDPGFDGTGVLTFRLTIPPGGMGRDTMPNFYSEILERVRAVPGVADVGMNSCAPMAGPCLATMVHRTGAPVQDLMHSPLAVMDWVTPNWFSVMRVPLRRGRLFTTADRAHGPKVVVLDETAARTFFGTEDPLGKHVSLGMGGVADAEVVGIVGGVRQRPDSAPAATAYAVYAQSPQPGMIVFVRAAGDAASLGAAVRRAVHDAAPNLPVYDMLTMAERTAVTTGQARFRTVLLSLFAVTALSLAAIGIYGVMSLAVTARTRELGIRIALGAERASVEWLVLGEGVRLVIVGTAIGVAGALAATQVLRSFLFDLTPSDPLTYVVVVVLLSSAAVAASWIPARRASRVDPVIALRAE